MTDRADKRRVSQITSKDEDLIALLRVNAREPVAALARKLGLSRTTVQDRLRRLEESGVIAGYSVKLAQDVEKAGIRAMVTIAVEPRRQVEVARLLARFPQFEMLYTVSGKVDLVGMVKTASAEDMDRLIDELGAIPGVIRTETSVILSTKLDRR
ncbi:MAG: Lrp/AsnC family transcriptional regulator [Rhizobiales bacterium]|nr:Lrp/AsnC family transcriptional regulator [Hyphomicrobiales bacterium]MBI3673294.1 Lrp/AsnC family transcriptional regulator [Hyphomicrobiales bacterium]